MKPSSRLKKGRCLEEDTQKREAQEGGEDEQWGNFQAALRIHGSTQLMNKTAGQGWP